MSEIELREPTDDDWLAIRALAEMALSNCQMHPVDEWLNNRQIVHALGRNQRHFVATSDSVLSATDASSIAQKYRRQENCRQRVSPLRGRGAFRPPNAGKLPPLETSRMLRLISVRAARGLWNSKLMPASFPI